MSVLLALIAGLSVAPAQQAVPAPCPTLSVSAMAGVKKVTFVADVSGTSDAVTYTWTISEGEIEAGQGKPVITVKAAKDAIVTATVEVGGLPKGCQNMESETEKAN